MSGKSRRGRKRIMQNPEFKPFNKGDIFGSQAKQIILNVFIKAQIVWPNKTTNEIANYTAQLTGVGTTTIYEVRVEHEKQKKLVTPPKKRPNRHPPKRINLYSDFELSAIRAQVHCFYRENEIPTLSKLISRINTEPELPTFSRSSLCRLLKDIGFAFKKRSRDVACLEREDIVVWRHRYLREIRRHRLNGRKIYYLDETWVNAGETANKIWVDKTIRNRIDAFKKGLTTGLKQPTGKGGRLIVGHIGSETGFVPSGLLLFRAKKDDGDYHGEMNGPSFNRWMEKVFGQLEPNSVIVLDYAPYHTVKVESIPTTKTRKNEIQAWLTQKGIAFTPSMLKPQLLQIVASVKSDYTAYQIDTRARELNFTVLRLPPYHCHLNPIEMVWAQVKNYVRKENRTFKLTEVEQRLREAVERVSPENWSNYIQHVIKEENKAWEMDSLMENVVEPLIITNDDSSTDDDNFSNQEES